VPPPAPVTVVEVFWVDVQRVLWSFTLPVLSVQNASGLFVNGLQPVGFELTDEGVYVDYPSDVNIDDPWAIGAGGPPVAITFGDGGGTLVVPESGNVN
jgi:hypothetical protein